MVSVTSGTTTSYIVILLVTRRTVKWEVSEYLFTYDYFS